MIYAPLVFYSVKDMPAVICDATFRIRLKLCLLVTSWLRITKVGPFASIQAIILFDQKKKVTILLLLFYDKGTL